MSGSVVNSKVYLVSEVAQILRISLQATYNLIHRGELPARKIGGSFRIFQSDLEDYLENGARYVPEQRPERTETVRRRRRNVQDPSIQLHHLKL